MKKLLLVVTLLLVVGLTNAYAIPITFNVDELYDWGRLYSYSGGIGGIYTPTNVNPLPFGTNSIPGYTITADTFGNADGAEDSWGIATLSSITSNPPGTTYFARSAAEELTFMFYGFDDEFLTTPNIAGTTTIGSLLGHVSVYWDTTPDFSGGLGTGGRTGVASYTGVTDGLLVLDLAPVPNAVGVNLLSTFDFATLAGSGAMYLSTTGTGAWDYLYDTNTQLFGSDFSMSYTVLDNSITPSTGDWVVRGDARGEGNFVPEPASMLLFGAGMLGLATLRRRKKAA